MVELSNKLESWKETYVTLMNNSYLIGRYRTWPVCWALFPHAKDALNSRLVEGKPLEAWDSVLFKAAWYADEVEQYSKSVRDGL